MTREEVRELVTLMAARLLADPGAELPDCLHRLRVGVNRRTSVCAVCRQVVEESGDCTWAVMIEGEEDAGFGEITGGKDA